MGQTDQLPQPFIPSLPLVLSSLLSFAPHLTPSSPSMLHLLPSLLPLLSPILPAFHQVSLSRLISLCLHLGPVPRPLQGPPPCRLASGCCSSLLLVSAPCLTCLSGPGRLQARLSGSTAIVCLAALCLFPGDGLA